MEQALNCRDSSIRENTIHGKSTKPWSVWIVKEPIMTSAIAIAFRQIEKADPIVLQENTFVLDVLVTTISKGCVNRLTLLRP